MKLRNSTSVGPRTEPVTNGVEPLEHRATEERIFEVQARFCRAMGHPQRVGILHLLHEAGDELPAAELRETLGLTHAALSQHLSRMSGAGLVRTRKEGRYLFVALACPGVGQACGLVRSALSKQARTWLSMLDADAE